MRAYVKNVEQYNKHLIEEKLPGIRMHSTVNPIVNLHQWQS